MEGRAIARPNGQGRGGLIVRRVASMEGRAIARPNCSRPAGWGCRTSCFNGGPSNCPAKRRMLPVRRQYLAGFNGGPSNCPAKRRLQRHSTLRNCASMEGRAIARPNLTGTPTKVAATQMLQWRAEQLPGQTWTVRLKHEKLALWLQWRAEQLPGQTRTPCPASRQHPCFNGGPSNCPAKPPGPSPGVPSLWPLQWRAEQLPGQTAPGGGAASCPPSMEGRAIDRPETRRAMSALPSRLLLQWRAEQLPGQTARLIWGG